MPTDRNSLPCKNIITFCPNKTKIYWCCPKSLSQNLINTNFKKERGHFVRRLRLADNTFSLYFYLTNASTKTKIEPFKAFII